MPIYEYRCQSCGHECEVLQKLSDPQLTDCPACQAPALKKKVSAAGFRLKGGGWYETDFKSDNKRNLVSADSKGKKESKDDGKSSSKSESKTANTKSSEKTKNAKSKPTESKSVKK